jgi:hypothetical protein
MVNIFSHKGNENQNYIEIPSDLSQNRCHQENQPPQMLVRMLGKRNPYTLLMRMQISASTMELGKEVPQKMKNRTNI